MNLSLRQWEAEWWNESIEKPWYRYPWAYDHVNKPTAPGVHIQPHVDRLVVRCASIDPIYHPRSLKELAATTYVRDTVRRIKYPSRKQKMLVRLAHSLLSSHPMMTRARLRDRGPLPRECETALHMAAGPWFKRRHYSLTFQKSSTSDSAPV